MSDDKVGYSKPPKANRWKKGQSGNPRGRPKGARGLKTELLEELTSRMTIQMNGKPITATKHKLMLKTLTARAATGDVRAARMMIDLIMQIFGPDDRGADKEHLSPQDQALLEKMLNDHSSSSDTSAEILRSEQLTG